MGNDAGARVQLMAGDCLEHLQEMQDATIDAVCIDPPAGISFMGKSWDSDHGGRDAWISWLAEIMREVWWNNSVGLEDKVIAPWTSMRLEGKSSAPTWPSRRPGWSSSHSRWGGSSRCEPLSRAPCSSNVLI